MEKGEFYHHRSDSTVCQSVFTGKRSLPEIIDGDDRKKRGIKSFRQFFKKGSGGSSLIGIAIMILILLIVVVLLISFNLRMKATDTQMAADSLADTVAVFMANEGGTYDEACEKMQETKELIEQETGIILDTVSLDETSLENNEAKITVETAGEVDASDYSIAPFSYTVSKTAVTEFKRRSTMSSVYGVDSDIDYVNWAIGIANDDSHGYCLSDVYQGTGHPDYDCSYLVSSALMEYGYVSCHFGTWGMYSVLTGAGFTCIPYSEAALQPGDILYRPAGGTRSAHTEIYVGNGWCVGAHQSEDESQDYSYGSPGDQTGHEIDVSLNDSAAKGWTRIFRAANLNKNSKEKSK